MSILHYYSISAAVDFLVFVFLFCFFVFCFYFCTVKWMDKSHNTVKSPVTCCLPVTFALWMLKRKAKLNLYKWSLLGRDDCSCTSVFNVLDAIKIKHRLCKLPQHTHILHATAGQPKASSKHTMRLEIKHRADFPLGSLRLWACSQPILT